MAAITPERVAAMQRLLEVVPADIQNTGGVVWTVDGHQVAEEEYEFEQVKLADCNDDLAEFAVAARTFVPDLLEAYAAATQWRDMATAPKDGTPVLLWWPYWDKHAIVGTYDEGAWHNEWALHHDDEAHGPMGWLPLPAPPVQEER